MNNKYSIEELLKFLSLANKKLKKLKRNNKNIKIERNNYKRKLEEIIKESNRISNQKLDYYCTDSDYKRLEGRKELANDILNIINKKD